MSEHMSGARTSLWWTIQNTCQITVSDYMSDEHANALSDQNVRVNVGVTVGLHARIYVRMHVRWNWQDACQTPCQNMCQGNTTWFLSGPHATASKIPYVSMSEPMSDEDVRTHLRQPVMLSDESGRAWIRRTCQKKHVRCQWMSDKKMPDHIPSANVRTCRMDMSHQDIVWHARKLSEYMSDESVGWHVATDVRGMKYLLDKLAHGRSRFISENGRHLWQYSRVSTNVNKCHSRCQNLRQYIWKTNWQPPIARVPVRL